MSLLKPTGDDQQSRIERAGWSRKGLISVSRNLLHTQVGHEWSGSARVSIRADVLAALIDAATHNRGDQ